METLDPTGEPIDAIDSGTKLLNENEAREHVANHLRLIEELFLNSIDGVQLSEHAIAGLAQAKKIN